MGTADALRISFVLGNGPSRQTIDDPSQLGSFGKTYGCNLIIEDCRLDNVVICDRSLVVHAYASGYDESTMLWTRRRWKDMIDLPRARALPDPIANPLTRWDKEQHWGSGTHAVNLAAGESDIVVMIGFDLWPNKSGSNNVYEDRQPFYERRAVDPGCWIHQFARLFAKYPLVSFVQIQQDDWQDPAEWKMFENYSRDTHDGLFKWIEELAND